MRAKLSMPAGATQEDILAAAKADPNVEKHLEGKTVIKEIYVPGKMVNLVVK